MTKHYHSYMNYLRTKEWTETLLRIERNTPRVVALRAPQALWPLALGFTLFSMWLVMSAGV
jgi:hypothetical protein